LRLKSIDIDAETYVRGYVDKSKVDIPCARLLKEFEPFEPATRLASLLHFYGATLDIAVAGAKLFSPFVVGTQTARGQLLFVHVVAAAQRQPASLLLLVLPCDRARGPNIIYIYIYVYIDIDIY
jgi:hypothetical protein